MMICWELTMVDKIPRQIYCMHSEPMNAGIRSWIVTMPLKHMAITEVIIHMRNARKTFWVACATCAANNPLKPTTAPTEKSIPPWEYRKDAPIAAMAMVMVELIMARMLLTSNSTPLLKIPNNTMTNASPRNGIRSVKLIFALVVLPVQLIFQ